MKIEDCEVGKNIKSIYDKNGRKVYKISEIAGNKIGVKNYPGLYLPKFFEPVKPVNKFEAGDKAIYKAENGKYYKCVIFGIAEQKDKFDGKYAISFEKGSGRKVNKVVKEKKLSPLKKEDELGVGDKFIRIGTKYEVLAVAYEEFRDSIIYFAKMLNGNLEGRIVDFNSEFIDEIIYD